MGKKKRLRLGIVLPDFNNWAGGRYYIFNLLDALLLLPREEQPFFTIYYINKDDCEQLKVKLKSVKHRFKQISGIYKKPFIVGINKISRGIIGKNIFQNRPLADNAFFPNPWQYYFKDVKNPVYWIPDFQEKYYPEFFSKEDVDFRESYNQNLIAKNYPIIFSSNDALNDFRKFYPESSNRTSVVQFAVTHPAFEHLDSNEVLGKFNITKPYFITPNQLWVHKNHQIVIEAAALLKKQGFEFQIVFSGKEYDERSPEHTTYLKEMIHKNDLETVVQFIGFVKREELLVLMKNSLAVIQPSLFEGWSTVVEDAKSMNKWVIASNLKVHREQLQTQANFFDPNNQHELSRILEGCLLSGVPGADFEYELLRKQFAYTFLHSIQNIVEL